MDRLILMENGYIQYIGLALFSIFSGEIHMSVYPMQYVFDIPI